MGEPVSGGGGWEDCSPGGEGGANVFVSAVVSKRKLLAKIFVSISSSCFQGGNYLPIYLFQCHQFISI